MFISFKSNTRQKPQTLKFFEFSKKKNDKLKRVKKEHTQPNSNVISTSSDSSISTALMIAYH